MHSVRSIRRVLLLAASMCGSAFSVASGFDAHCAPRAERRFAALQFGATTPQGQTLATSLPPDTSVLLVVSEDQQDVRVEVRAARKLQSSDSPLRRWGPQYLLFDATSPRNIEITAVRKEGVRGSARAQLYEFTRNAEDLRCMAVYRALGGADAHYARGQAIVLGLASAEAGALKREYEAALAGYSEAVHLLRGVGGPVEARARLAAATVLLYGLQNYDEGRREAQMAQLGFAAVADAYGEDRARAIEAGAEIEIALAIPGRRKAGSPAKARTADLLAAAREKYAVIKRGHAARGEWFDQALAQNNIGLSYFYGDAFSEAIEAYQQAGSIYAKLGERIRHAQVQQNISQCYTDLGRLKESRQSFAAALSSFDLHENPKLHGDILNNLALAERKSGMPDVSLNHYDDALEIFERLQNLREQARSLQGLGHTYYSVGNRTEALKYFERALDLRPAARDAKRNLPADPVGRLTTLRAMADIHADTGSWVEAIRLREQALALTETPVQRARALVEIARDSIDGGDLVKARGALEEIFANDAGQDPVVFASAIQQRGRLHLREGRMAAARNDVGEALSIFRAKQLPKHTFDALLLRSRIECAAGNRTDAMASVDESLTSAEIVRQFSANPIMRTSLWQELRAAFDLKIEMLAQSSACGGIDGTAPPLQSLQVSEDSRNRALAEYAGIAAARRGAAVSEAERRRREIFDAIAGLREQIDTLLESNGDADSRLPRLREEVAHLQREVDILDAQRGSVLRQSRSKKGVLSRSIEMIPRDTAVIEYWLGSNNTYAWLIDGGRVRMFNLGSTARIDSAARALHAAMRDFAIAPGERTRRSIDLHRLVVAPLGIDKLRVRTLHFVADGSLHAVPFAALASGTTAAPHYLVEDFDIAVAAGAVFPALGGDKIALRDARVLMIADPVYSVDDTRLGRKDAERVAQTKPRTLRGGDQRPRSRLPASAAEANAVSALFAPGHVELLSGFEATREAFLGRDLKQYRVIHFATHAVADTEAPQLSALHLSSVDATGKARPGEVFSGDLLSREFAADLFVLSACDTALGANAAGEGLLGLRYAAHASGARFVVASLWPVVDTVGADLISRMYAGVVREGATPVAALSAAMRAARKRWDDPALWAVFEVSHASRAASIH
jgi:CHAT domain-containing protein/tetratricopeptide (TPR) repeat protein